MTNDDEARRLAEFVQFIAACPPEQEIHLRYDNVSTAFHRARSQGWTVDELAADAVASFRRGAGVGAVVVRLETMGRTRRATGSNNVVRGPWQPPRFVPPEVQRIPAEWARQRMELLRHIWAEHVPADEAEDAMRDLIATQKAGEAQL